MSLPKYIINFPELEDLIRQIKDDSSYSIVFDTGKQKSKGMRLKSDEGKLTVSDTWYPNREIYVTGIKLGTSERESLNNNKMSILLNGRLTFEDVYFKKESDYKNFRIPEKVLEGSSVEVVLNSKSPAEVWVDVDYIDSVDGKIEIDDIQNEEPED